LITTVKNLTKRKLKRSNNSIRRELTNPNTSVLFLSLTVDAVSEKLGGKVLRTDPQATHTHPVEDAFIKLVLRKRHNVRLCNKRDGRHYAEFPPDSPRSTAKTVSEVMALSLNSYLRNLAVQCVGV
jgi:hypothetical protein